MLFPLRTDRELTHWPWVNVSLIALNLLIFVITYYQIRQADVLFQIGLSHDEMVGEVPAYGFYLHPQAFKWYQLITYQFLHADAWHVAGNMIFLWAFGNCVEDRLGKIGYLALFLGGGALAGVGHMFIDPEHLPVIGASGSVAAVSGCFLALFPEVRITVFVFITVVDVSGKLFIALFIAWDVVSAVLNLGGNVAYLAHLSGYAAGFATGMLLLTTKLLPRERYDLISTIERYREKRSFKKMVDQGYRPWEGETHDQGVAHRDGLTDEQREQMNPLQTRMSSVLNEHDFAAAAAIYKQMLAVSSEKVVSSQSQMDVANQLMAEGDHHTAAIAYELLISRYPKHDKLDQAKLMLGLIYVRYLSRKPEAILPLREAARRLTGGEKELAEQLIREANGSD